MRVECFNVQWWDLVFFRCKHSADTSASLSHSISPQAGTLAIGAARSDHATDSSTKKSPSTADDLDFISYLAGELPKPAALQTAAVEVERRLRGAVEPRHQVVSVKMGVEGGAVDKGVADKFLDRVGYYVANPENLML